MRFLRLRDGAEVSHGTVLGVTHDGWLTIYEHGALENVHAVDFDAVPDLTDPATLGCVLALVREAWGRPDLYMRRIWRNDLLAWQPDCVGIPDGLLFVYGATEAEALVLALEAAPVPS